MVSRIVCITTSFNLIHEFMKYTLFKIEIACNRMQFSKMLHEVSETKVLHHRIPVNCVVDYHCTSVLYRSHAYFMNGF